MKIIQETVCIISASRTFELNVTVINVREWIHYNEIYMNKSALYTFINTCRILRIYIQQSFQIRRIIHHSLYYVFDFLIVFVMLKVLVSKKSNFPHWTDIMFYWHDIYIRFMPCLTTDFSLVDYIYHLYIPLQYSYKNGYAMCAELWLWIERVEYCLPLYKYWLNLKGNFQLNLKLWVEWRA